MDSSESEMELENSRSPSESSDQDEWMPDADTDSPPASPEPAQLPPLSRIVATASSEPPNQSQVDAFLDENFLRSTPMARKKRQLLRSLLDVYFDQYITIAALNPVYRDESDGPEDYLARYWDPFSGADEVANDTADDDVLDCCDLGSAVVAVSACVDRVAAYKYYGPDRNKRAVVKCAKFIFLDVASVVPRAKKSLRDLVRLWFERLGWRTDHEGRRGLNCREFVFATDSRFGSVTYLVKVEFLDRGRTRWRSTEQLGYPLFACADPVAGGLRGLDQEATCRLAGQRDRFLLLTLTEESLKRRGVELKEGLSMEALECDAWRNAFAFSSPHVDKTKDHAAVANFKLQKLAELYTSLLRHRLKSKKAFVGSFAFRRDRDRDPGRGTLLYLIFGCSSMCELQKFKFSLQRHSRPLYGEEGIRLTMDRKRVPKFGLYYSDYFEYNGCPADLGRRFSAREEANVIFEEFCGTERTLGEVKRFVLEETGFPFHARSMRLLERDGFVRVDTRTGRPTDEDDRIHYTFHSNHLTKDETEDAAGNLWTLKFAEEEEGRQLKLRALNKEVNRRIRREKPDLWRRMRPKDVERQARELAARYRGRAVALKELKRHIAAEEGEYGTTAPLRLLESNQWVSVETFGGEERKSGTFNAFGRTKKATAKATTVSVGDDWMVHFADVERVWFRNAREMKKYREKKNLKRRREAKTNMT